MRSKIKRFPEIVSVVIDRKRERAYLQAKPSFDQYVALEHACEEAGGAIKMFHPKFIRPKDYYATLGIRNRTFDKTADLEERLKRLPGVRTAIIDSDRWFTNEQGIEVGGVVVFAEPDPRLPTLMEQTGRRAGIILENRDHDHDNRWGAEWSEFNHSMSGLILLLLAIVGALQVWVKDPPPVIRYGTTFLWVALFVFLFIRSDPEAWPLGKISWWASWRDWEVAQHRISFGLVLGIAAADYMRIAKGWKVNSQLARWGPLFIGLVGSAVLFLHQHRTIDPSHVAMANRMNAQHLAMASCGLLFGVTKFVWDSWHFPRRGGPYVWLGCLAAMAMVLLFYVE